MPRSDSPETAAVKGEQSAGPRLRALRLGRGMSLAAVAAEAGVTKGFLSLAERGKSRLSVPTLLRICEVLDVQLGELFEYPSGTIVHGGVPLDMGGTDIEEFMLTPSAEQHLQVVRSVIQPGGGSGGTYTLATTSIFALVLRGSLELTVGGTTRFLAAGDSTTFSARSEHGFINPGPTATEVVWTLVPPLPHGSLHRDGR